MADPGRLSAQNNQFGVAFAVRMDQQRLAQIGGAVVVVYGQRQSPSVNLNRPPVYYAITDSARTQPKVAMLGGSA